MHSFEVHSNESVCRKSGHLGLEQVYIDTCVHVKSCLTNGSEFKRDFTPLLKDLYIKPVLTSVKKNQANAPVEQVHQVILNILVTKDIDNEVFVHIYPWGETLAYIA